MIGQYLKSKFHAVSKPEPLVGHKLSGVIHRVKILEKTQVWSLPSFFLRRVRPFLPSVPFFRWRPVRVWPAT